MLAYMQALVYIRCQTSSDDVRIDFLVSIHLYSAIIRGCWVSVS